MTGIKRVFSLAVLLAGLPAAPATGGGPATGPRHFIFFDLERQRIREESFLATNAIAGAQLKYTWRELEPQRGQYNFQPLREDLAFLKQHGKRLFVQLQDVSFDESINNVPEYLLDNPEFHGGVARKYRIQNDDESTAVSDGWVARRWDAAVRNRFIKLLQALGREFDGHLEGINLAETSVDFGDSGKLHPEGFTYERYVEGVKVLMAAAREAFPRSHVIQYANFMPGEWLPWSDHGYLRSIYAHAEKIGAGVGGPDLLPHRKGQQNHSYPLIAGRSAHTIAGVAVQWGNLDARNPATGLRVTVSELARFAEQVLHLDYIFWGIQEPYYSGDILPYLRNLSENGGK